MTKIKSHNTFCTWCQQFQNKIWKKSKLKWYCVNAIPNAVPQKQLSFYFVNAIGMYLICEFKQRNNSKKSIGAIVPYLNNLGRIEFWNASVFDKNAIEIMKTISIILKQMSGFFSLTIRFALNYGENNTNVRCDVIFLHI